jgi:hypothetical protein
MRTANRVVIATMLLVCVSFAVGAEEPVGNNLSYPASYTVGPADTYGWWPPASPVFRVHYSYGCDLEETIDQFKYPNTSCVLDDETTYLFPEECIEDGAPCAGFTLDQLDLIYWQKVVDVEWSAETISSEPPVVAAYLDWSDNIESNTWTVTSVIRIETQPYSTSIIGFDPTTDECDDPDLCLTGFEMWHASGHGTTEHWGVRVENNHTPFEYESPFSIIHTPRARLNIAKLETTMKECPVPGGSLGDPPPDLDLVWMTELDPNNPQEILYGWWENDGGGIDPCALDDVEQTVELNVGGKWTYGYNWMTKRMDFDVCEALGFEDVEGWWRLTFYTEDGSVDFTAQGQEYWDNPEVIGPPPPIPAEAVAMSDPATDDALYPPKVDTVNNLTYIDFCLSKKGGGGGGGSGGNHGGGT